MRFQRQDGTGFEMNITGYAAPRARSYGQANLLRQKIMVNGPYGSWQAEFPGITTYEAAWLADWLEQVASGTEMRQRLDFLEPSLAFSLIEASGERSVRIFLEWQARPVWMFARSGSTHEVWLDFPVSAKEELFQAAAQLKQSLVKYPERQDVNVHRAKRLAPSFVQTTQF